MKIFEICSHSNDPDLCLICIRITGEIATCRVLFSELQRVGREIDGAYKQWYQYKTIICQLKYLQPMKSIDILKHIVNRPGVFKTPWQREKARFNLHEKMKRRDRKLMKLQQLKIEI